MAANASAFSAEGRREAVGRLARPGPLAQLVEQGTLNPKVVGSIPTRPIESRPTTRERMLVAVGLMRPHTWDLSTANSQPGEAGLKPCSISQRAACRLRND